MDDRLLNLQRQVERIHRAALDAMTQPRTPADTRTSLQQIAEEALALSRGLSELGTAERTAAAIRSRERQLLRGAREFIVRVIATIWRSNNGP